MLFRKELAAPSGTASLSQQESDLPSLTALLVMIGLKISLARDNDHLFEGHEVMVRHMIECAAKEMSSIPSLSEWERFIRKEEAEQLEYLEKKISPGFCMHKYARKYMVKHKIEEGIQNNKVKQVVLLSGGYDPGSYKLARKYRHVNFYELDRGRTREIKINGLKTAPVEDGMLKSTYLISDGYACFGDNLHLIECDFIKDNLKEKLCSRNFSSDKNTLVISEGLTMYLTKEDNQALLRNMFDLLKDNDQILIGFRSNITNPSKAGDRVLSASKEPFQFVIDPQNLPAFVIELGFDTCAKMTCQDLLEWAQSYEKDCRGDSYFLLRRNSLLQTNQHLPADINKLPLIETSVLTVKNKP